MGKYQIYAGAVVPERHQARSLQVFVFSVFLSRSCAGADDIQGHVGRSSLCATSSDSASPQSSFSGSKGSLRFSHLRGRSEVLLLDFAHKFIFLNLGLLQSSIRSVWGQIRTHFHMCATQPHSAAGRKSSLISLKISFTSSNKFNWEMKLGAGTEGCLL